MVAQIVKLICVASLYNTSCFKDRKISNNNLGDKLDVLIINIEFGLRLDKTSDEAQEFITKFQEK